LIALVGLVLVGCGKTDGSKAKEQKPLTSQPAQVSAPALSTAAAQEIKTPRESPILVMASANGSVRPTVTAGWPVVIEVRLLLKPDAGASLNLSHSAGAWSDALTLECIGPDGTNRAALFSPAYKSGKSIELTRARSGMMVWVLDAVVPGSLPEGPHQIRVILDEKKLGADLPAGLASRPIVVIVAPDSATPLPGADQRKCVAMMTASTWKNDPAKALATANTYLANHPKDVAVLLMQGKVQRSQGKKVEALASFQAAFTAAEENKEPMGENFAIQRVIGDLQRELASK
jgi:hypothetical protein